MKRPPFCPNPKCSNHHYQAAEAAGVFWIRKGSYTTQVSGEVQRFRCRLCGRGFSERTTSIDYFAKKALDYPEIHRATCASESVSSIARHLGCSVASVVNRQDRLGRNCLAMQARLLEGHRLEEDLVADGFESFDRSQYFPNAINILVGAQSQHLYGFTHATLRRKGRMTAAQKKRRDELEELFTPPRGALRASFASLLEGIVPMWERSSLPTLVFRTDEHPCYPGAIRRIPELKMAFDSNSFVHERYSSRAPRTKRNPLFPVNYYDRELRKDIAAYRRESTCFGRNVANGLLRLGHHMVWHNYLKPLRIVSTAEKPETHAVTAGIGAGRIQTEMNRLYMDRAFLSHQRLSAEQKRIWLKRHPTPLKVGKDYCPAFAQVGKVQGSEN